jgi:hypothetical protein
MANLIPPDALRAPLENRAESRALEFLETLPGVVTVRYDYHWQPRKGRQGPAAGQADIVLLLKGEGLLLLEVKGSHRFANRGKGPDGPAKHVVYDEFGNPAEIDCPFSQAIGNLEEIRRDLSSWAGGPLDFPMEWAVLFPNLAPGKGSVENPEWRERVIASEDMERTDDFLEKARSLLNNSRFSGERFDSAAIEMAEQCLACGLELAPVWDLRFADDELRFQYLSKAQSDFFAKLAAGHDRLIVTGPAGSGKTLMGLAAARKWLLSNEGRVGPGKVVFLCWTKLLSRWIRLNNPNSEIIFDSFHQFVRKTADEKRLPVPAGTEAGPYDRALIEISRSSGPFIDFLVVDECQDFGGSSLLHLTDLVKEGGRQILSLDTDQSVFRRMDNLTVVVPAGATFDLGQNCRNSKSIARLAAAILRDITGTEPGAGDVAAFFVPEGQAPSISPVSENEEAHIRKIREILEKWLRQGVSPSRIAILTPRRDNGFPDKVGSIDYTLDSVPKRALVLPDGEGDSDAPLRSWMADMGVIWSTISSFKGMEASHVIVCDIRFNGIHGDAWMKRQVYLGITRALNVLALVPRDREAMEYVVGASNQ